MFLFVAISWFRCGCPYSILDKTGGEKNLNLSVYRTSFGEKDVIVRDTLKAASALYELLSDSTT
jgi:hypothetical protein